MRIQPLLPGDEAGVTELVDAASKKGARHISLEHLKMPVERDWRYRDKLNEAVGYDLDAYFSQRNAYRSGREWILPPEERLETIARVRKQTHVKGMSFGAADSDFLHWSDGEVCCSGADLAGLGEGMKFNFTTAIRRGIKQRKVTYESIREEWRPERSIAQFINSHSRKRSGETVASYIRDRWNGAAYGPSPLSFYGVEKAMEKDREGFDIYTIRRDGLPPD